MRKLLDSFTEKHSYMTITLSLEKSFTQHLRSWALLCRFLSACCAGSYLPVVLAPVCVVQREECIPVMVLDRVGPHRLGGNLRSEHVDPDSYFLWFSERSNHRTLWVPGADEPLKKTSHNWLYRQSRMGTKAPQLTVDISAHVHTLHHIG